MNRSQLRHSLALLAGPLCALLLCASNWVADAWSTPALMSGLIVWMALWWMLEPVHLAVTSLLPLTIMPLTGIADMRDVAAQYMDQVMFLFIGGFLLAFAVEKHGLHQRIALGILSRLGSSPNMILLGVMLASWIMSMWISNTATVMMLLAAVLALISQMEGHFKTQIQEQRFAAALLLGLAFSATIGGMATLVGTPPNIVFYRFYLQHFPKSGDMDFMQWFLHAAPLSLLFLGIAYFVLRLFHLRGAEPWQHRNDYFREKHKLLGAWSRNEKVVLLIFGITVLLWFTREGFRAGSLSLPGWSALFPQQTWIQDSTVAITMALLLFLIPAARKKGESMQTRRHALLEWDDAAKLPFHVLLLFGSGFALAFGFEHTGLSESMAGSLSRFKDIPVWQLQLIIILIVTLISEFASNVASIQLVLPVLLAMHKAMEIDALDLMLPATLAASMGFMLPVATAPNTIVFGAGKMRVTQMVRAGFMLDIIGTLLVLALCVLWLNQR
jgi:solute carrier family 13 (sodium-dependent dicarboxylate transporter), member 2/3/5